MCKLRRLMFASQTRRRVMAYTRKCVNFYNSHPIFVGVVTAIFMFSASTFLAKRRLIYVEDNLFSTSTPNLPEPEAGESATIEIPKIIHQTWIGEEIPNQFSPFVKTWLERNHDFEYWLWTDDDARRLIARKYPDFLHLFDSYAWNIQRADVMRYFILYEYGGVYVDLDVEGLKPIAPILDGPCFMSQEPFEHSYFYWGMDYIACNAIMACRPRHPYFAQILSQLSYHKGVSVFPLLKVPMPVMKSSGPMMTTDVYRSYNELAISRLPPNRVSLWPVEYFFPDADLKTLSYVKSKCSNPSLRETMTQKLVDVCRYHERTEFANTVHGDPYGRHHWSHTYYGVEKKGTTKIRQISSRARVASNILEKELSIWTNVKLSADLYS